MNTIPSHKNLKINIAMLHHVGKENSDKLHTAQIFTIEDLLLHCATPQQRHQIEQATAIPHLILLEIAHCADVMRIAHVGIEHAFLLVSAGVNGLNDLAHRNAVKLHEHLLQINDSKGIVSVVPSETECAFWISDAQALEPMIKHN